MQQKKKKKKKTKDKIWKKGQKVPRTKDGLEPTSRKVKKNGPHAVECSFVQENGKIGAEIELPWQWFDRYTVREKKRRKDNFGHLCRFPTNGFGFSKSSTIHWLKKIAATSKKPKCTWNSKLAHGLSPRSRSRPALQRRDFLSNSKYRYRPLTQPDIADCWLGAVVNRLIDRIVTALVFSQDVSGCGDKFCMEVGVRQQWVCGRWRIVFNRRVSRVLVTLGDA